MNLGFTADDEALRPAFRRLLASGRRHAALQAGGAAGLGDAALWQRLAEQGWLATAVPESFGGSALDGSTLCVLAEEAGRVLAAVPFVASACGFTQALLLSCGDAAAAATASSLWPGLADGSVRGVLLCDDCWPEAPRLADEGGAAVLSGRASNVPDAPSATHAMALVGQGAQSCLVLWAVESSSRGAAALAPLDLLHHCADLVLERQPVQVLARGAAASALWYSALDRQALYVAFEQLGGAEAALAAARAYSLQRYAFGRPIGSFQALKHMMADMLVAVDLARSNCLFGAAALAVGGDTLTEAAAVARISATEAFRTCAIGSTQVHGALGVTWEADCHLYYRRAQALAGSPGSLRSWKERLVQLLERRACAAAAA